MEKLKLNLMRFDDGITIPLKVETDYSDIQKLADSFIEPTDAIRELGEQLNVFQQQIDQVALSANKNLDIMEVKLNSYKTKVNEMQKSMSESMDSRMISTKDVDLDSIGTSSISSVKSKLQGVLTVIENIKGTSETTDFSAMERSLRDIGMFESLSQPLQDTITNLSKMGEVVKGNSGDVSQLENTLKNTINTLSTLTQKQKENTQEVKNNKTEYISYDDVIKGVNNSIAGLVAKFNVTRGVMRRISSEISRAVVQSADYVESINLFNMALDEYADGLNDWVKIISEKLYLDPSEVYQYTGSFYNLAKGLGVAGQNAAFMAKNLTQLTYDMTSYLNLKPEVAYNKLLSAMSGQTKAVTNVGIAVQRASLQELANKLGIEKKVETMTQAEKTYLRYIQIMRSTTQMQGDLGRTIITPTNAMRLFQTQITLTARAIGQVLTPIIMKLLPYLIALTQLLQEAAQRLASMLGFKLSDFEVDASSISKMFSDIGDGAGEANDSVGKLNRTLAKFDDLNVVESASSGSGSGLADEFDFSKYLTGYDMLKDYTDKMAKQIEIAKKNLEGFFNIAKKVAIVIATIAGIKGIIKLVSGLKKAWTWLKKLWTGWKGVEGATKGFKGIGTILSGWVKSIGGIGAALTGIATTLTGLIVYIKGLTGFTDDIKQWNIDFYGASEGAAQLRLHIVELVGGFSLLAVGAGVLFGPVGGLIVTAAAATITLATTLLQTSKAIEEMKYQHALLLTEFANTGPTLDVINESFHMVFGKFSEYNDETQSLMKQLDSSEETLDKTAKSFDNLAWHIKFGDYQGDVKKAYADIEDNLESLTSATTTHYENVKNFQLNEIEQLAKEKVISKDTYQSKKKDIEEYYGMLTSRSAQYNSQYASYLKELADGTITQDEYNKKMSELNARYADVAQSTDTATNSFSSYAETIKEGINIAGQSAEDIKTSVSDLTDEYNKQKDAIETNYNTQRKLSLEEIADAKEKLKTYREGSEEYQKTANHIKELEDTMATNAANSKTDLLKLNVTYTTTMQSLYKTMEEAGVGSSKAYKDVMDEIETKTDESMSYLSNNLQGYKSINTEAGSAVGYAINDGMMIGIQNGQKQVFEAVKKENGDIIWQIKDDFGIHSPSKITTEFGEYITEGLANGISDSYVMSKVENACRNLVKTVTNSLKGLNATADFKISVNIESSFNNILNKLDTFCNNWRDAINSLARNMANTMNNIKIDGNGKVTYNTMPKVSVRRFENSGYPKSGEMFFMNENGRAEYMTKVGNKTAVVNQDHMTTALADTITRAIGSIPTGGTGDVVVYIGNDKVYQGQGEYQSRETDRYGTTYVKI